MPEPTIVFEEKNFAAVNKPSGWLTHHAGHGKDPLAPALTDWLFKRYPEIKNIGDAPEERPGIVHRLDKETSGIILIPRTQEYFEYLKSLFKDRKTQKTYLALVHGIPPKSGSIEEPIGIKSGTIMRSVGKGKMLKPAATEYKTLKTFGEGDSSAALLEVSPKTGRTHQIRVHLKHIGHPIFGDKVYGRRKDKTERLMLHALSIEFEAEPGKRIKIEAEPPEDFRMVIDNLVV